MCGKVKIVNVISLPFHHPYSSHQVNMMRFKSGLGLQMDQVGKGGLLHWQEQK